MIEDSKFVELSSQFKELKVDAAPSELASWAMQNAVNEEELKKLEALNNFLLEKKRNNIVETLRKMSRLPQKAPKLFSNFELRDLGREAQKKIEALKTLSFIEAKKNVIMIGPTGTGKTHLAQAIGNECCAKAMKAYFIKMSELQEKFHNAIVQQTTGKLLNALSKYSCFIIDEAGYGQFNTEETRLFFQLIDRIDSKQIGSIIVTSNKELSDWEPLFSDLDALECTLDRIWNNAICITFSGRSYRGKDNEQLTFDFSGGFEQKF